MSIIGEKQRKILQEVVSLPTAPLHEQEVMRYVQNFVYRLALPIRQDGYGNLIAEYAGDTKLPPLGCVAHMDHPGFLLESIKNGCFKLAFYGGAACPAKADKLSFFCQGEETILSVEDLVYAPAPPTTQPQPTAVSPAQGTSGAAPKATHVLASYAGVLPDSVVAGFAMHQLPPFRQEGEIVYSRAIDDLAGCAAILALLELLVERKARAYVYAIFTRAEEIGFIGAYGLAMSNILPDKLPIVSLEASKMLPLAEQGKGVVVRLGDKRAIFDAKISTFLSEVAQELAGEDAGFLFQRRLLDGGTCEGALFNAFAYPASGLAVPLACYHNQGEQNRVAAENIHLRDWYGMVELLFAVSTCTSRLVGWEEGRLAYFTERFNKYRDRFCPLPIV
jgi:endoglucanase